MENIQNSKNLENNPKNNTKNKTSWDEKAIYAICILTASYFFLRLIAYFLFNL
jgi:hypothetical protein